MNNIDALIDSKSCYSSQEKDRLRELHSQLMGDMKENMKRGEAALPQDQLRRMRYEALVKDYVSLLGQSEVDARAQASALFDTWLNMEII